MRLYSNRPNILAYIIIVFGGVLLCVGLWNLIPSSTRSDTSSNVLMIFASIGILFPIIGISMIVIGNALLMIVREQHKEWDALKQELYELRKAVEDK